MLGNRIKSLRKENQMNQTELGQKIGVGRTTITEYEAGRIQPPYDKLQAMAKLFGVSVKYLTGETNSKNDDDVFNSIEDIAEHLNSIIDSLERINDIVKFNGKNMSAETRKLISEQLSNTVRLGTILNQDEQ